MSLITHDAIAAGAFTGSTAAGRLLSDAAAARPSPIPFYGELGSVNPAFVSREAIDDRGAEIAAGFAASFTLGAGQFCTKPGILFLPRGHGLLDLITGALREVGPARLLSERIEESYQEAGRLLDLVPGLEPVLEPAAAPAGIAPSLYRTTASVLREHHMTLLEERFGPSAIVVEYDDPDELSTLAALFEGPSTFTVHARTPDDDGIRALLAVAQERSGRIVWNGWPTGVTVSAAMTHGGALPREHLGTAHLGRHHRDPPVPSADHLPGHPGRRAPCPSSATRTLSASPARSTASSSTPNSRILLAESLDSRIVGTIGMANQLSIDDWMSCASQ